MKLSTDRGTRYKVLFLNREHFVYVLFNYEVATCVLRFILALNVCKVRLYSNGHRNVYGNAKKGIVVLLKHGL